MAAKDPACLFFIDKWLVATKEMKAPVRGWYLNLILHQFDKGDLPTDIEELANLADVRFSEFDLFQQEFQQVLQHKFQPNGNGRLENAYATQILKGREAFKEKREAAGRMSSFIKYVRANLCQDENTLAWVKKNVDLKNVDLTNKDMLQQVFQHMLQLYINVNVNAIINKEEKEGAEGKETFLPGSIQTDEIKPQTHTPTPTFNPGASVLIVPELKMIFLKHRTTYQFDVQKDAKPLRLIGEAIAKAENISAYEVAGVERIKEIFEALVVWSLSNTIYKHFQLSQFEKYIQAIFEAFKASLNDTKKRSTIDANIQTANGALSILQKQYESEN